MSRPRAVCPTAWLLAVFLIGCAGGTSPSLSATQFPAAAASPSAISSTPAVPSSESSGSSGAPATRLVIPALGVDLPVIAGVTDAQGNPVFPPCDVASYLPYYVQPAQAGTTYLYAHARRGMLLPLLEASRVNDGAALIGQEVDVYTSDGRRYVYQGFVVERHTTDYSLADAVAPGEQRLIVQTSEGPADDPNKVQLGAHLVSSEPGPIHVARPSAAPRECSPDSTE
ncbi:MAG TPA: sortase [Candidatus Limnocylindria bacterium]|nr:sortase [Candidatus Limnocylindria bacterium]